MSKMKHLLRKFNLTTSDHHTRHHTPHRPPPSPPQPPPSSSSTSSSPPSTTPSPPPPTSESVAVNENRRNASDYNSIEEDFQIQLAMAMSASDPERRNDDESDNQIMAAKQLSLACSPSVPDNERLSEFLSLKFWNYNVVQYDEKVVDGFYDVYAIASRSTAQGEMPVLVDLQAISICGNVEYEVVLVNRSVDVELRHLENKVYAISVECKVLGQGMYLNGLIQRLADLVVDRLGGPVSNAEEITTRWRVRSKQLRTSLNTIVLPLGSLNVGLSRHRALLFKVLADRIDLPCMLVKGSLYTGTDEGAVNLIKFDDGSEYIIDLMCAPGTLIPSEVPSSLLLDAALQARGLSDRTAAVNNLSLAFDKVVELDGNIHDIIEVSEVLGSNLDESASLFGQSKQINEIAVSPDLNVNYDCAFEMPSRSESSLYDCSPSAVEEASLAQEKKVKDVSKYVISAAKDPEFAQKLHAVLLESGASPPADLFVDMSPSILREQTFLDLVQPVRQDVLCSGDTYNLDYHRSSDEMPILCQSGVKTLNNCDKSEHSVDNVMQQHLQVDANLLFSPRPNAESDMTESNKMIDGAAVDFPGGLAGHGRHVSEDSSIKFLDQIESGEESCIQLDFPGDGHNECLSPISSEGVFPVLDEFAEWEIRWEDLQIGERIGIGSYGEVYRADWNDTEVAVKKFLLQDLTGDVLFQFKCEAEMMIRLQHPNVVLFMGAVTRPPNLSILTEFLPRGSLYRILHRTGSQIDENKRMKMALDVARGMNYLHTSHPTVVHRDLKTPNLLVDKNWGVKVCDFGLSRLKHHTFLSSNSTAGTPEWMAPEVLRNEPSSEKCDIYSFGVILWELATLSVPWSGLNSMQVVGAVGFQNRRLTIPKEVDPLVAQIIQDCWENDPRLRPSFSQLISSLKGLHRLVVQKD